MATKKAASAPGKTGERKKIGEAGKAEMIGYYRDMLLIRRFEEKAG